MERLTLNALRQYERALLALYLKRLRYRGEVELYAFGFAAEEASRQATVLAARLHLACDDDSSLWCTATLGVRDEEPREHEHQFVSILDTDALEAVEWLCGAYHYDRYVERLGEGHTFPLPRGGRIWRRGYASALVLGGDFYHDFATNLGKAAGTPTALFAVVPLTEPESALKRDRGLDELLEDWERTGRDALHFRTEQTH